MQDNIIRLESADELISAVLNPYGIAGVGEDNVDKFKIDKARVEVSTISPFGSEGAKYANLRLSVELTEDNPHSRIELSKAVSLKNLIKALGNKCNIEIVFPDLEDNDDQ